MSEQITLVAGQHYELSTLKLVGWTKGDGSGSEGYTLGDYFDQSGTYLGGDIHKIEPIVEIRAD